jgi:hypothetical protein
MNMFLKCIEVVGILDAIDLLFLPYRIDDEYNAQGYKYGQHIMSF